MSTDTVVELTGRNLHQSHRFPDGEPPFRYNLGFFDKKHMQPVSNSHRSPELLLCIDGDGYVIYNREVLPFHVGDLIMIDADIIHRVGTETNIRYRIMIIDDLFLDRIGISVDTLHLIPCCHDKQACELYENAVHAYELFDETRTLRTVIALCELTAYLTKHYTSPNATAKSEPKIQTKMREAIRYIRANFNRSVSVEEIAGTVSLSVSHYSREFRSFTGLTTVEYLNNVRCREANRLLREGWHVSDAAKACGFENLSYFARVYRAYTGEAPSETLAKSKEGNK